MSIAVEQLKMITEGVPYIITNLSNASAVLNENLKDINWAGFYIFRDNKLILGPFQGKVACTVIPMGKGVCGTAAIKNETLVVPNVHEFAGHIACDSASNSEIVIPIHFASGALFGVLDIDSPSFDRFEKEKEWLSDFVKVIENNLENWK